MRKMPYALVAAALLASPSIGLAAEVEAPVQNTDGEMIGAVRLADTPSGVVSVIIELTNVPVGVHGVHLHETGDCSAEDFSSAGDHIAGDAAHGVLAEDGPHPGDLPNVTVADNGDVQTEFFLTGLNIDEHILDDDGAAFIVHSGIDDYESQPSGDSGDRIACGAFEERS
jgi:superoxide dismutase, Cu-Zn family